MNSEMLLGLANNAALLLALAVLYETSAVQFEQKSRWLEMVAGLVIGLIGVAVMLTPWRFAPGVIFDTRSILLGITGLFFGVIPTAGATVITSLFRLYQGGAGALTGVGVIVISAGIGLLWRYFRKEQLERLGWRELYLFGLAIHAAMLLWMLTLPWPIATEVLRQISLPVMLIFPIATVLLGRLLVGQRVRRQTEQRLLEREAQLLDSEQRFRWAVEEAPFPIIIHAEDGQVLSLSRTWTEISGYSQAEIPTISAWTEQAYGDRKRQVKAGIDRLYSLGSRVDEGEFLITCKDGSQRVWDFSSTPLGPDLDGRQVVISMAADVTRRKQSEEALKESEARYRSLFENNHAVMLLINPDGGAIVDANPAACDYYGFTQAELRQKRIGEINILSFEEVQAEMELARSEQRRQFFFKHELADGAIRDVEVYSGPIQIGGQALLYSIVHDITERKEAEAELRHRNQFIETILEKLPIGLAVNQIDTGAATYMNSAFENIYGWPTEKLKDVESFFQCVFSDPDYRQQMSEQIMADISSGDPARMQWEGLRVTDQAGQKKIVTAINIPLFEQNLMISTVQDITDRKQAEEALHRHARRLETLHRIDQAILTNTSSEAIAAAALEEIRQLIPCRRATVCLIDTATGQMMIFSSSINGRSTVSSGMQLPLTREWATRLQAGENILFDDISQVETGTGLDEQLAAEGIRSGLIVPLIVRNDLIGALTMGSDHLAAFRDEHQEIAREVADQLAIAIQQNRLHEQVQQHAIELEQQVAERTAELEIRNRELETFSYSVSHDLKAPLRGIDGYSRLLLEDYADKLDEEGQQFLRTIRRATGQMHELIEDLLAYSRVQRRQMNLTPLDPEQLVRALVAERAGELQHRAVDLSIDIRCDGVVAEAEGLNQALRNLLDNALKFTRDASPPRIEIGSRPEGDACLFWVRDNGIGFEPQYHDRIFEIFQRLHRIEEYPGTGIGLALVSKVIDRMGGQVWAESEPGGGATFYLKIPRGSTS